MRKFFNVGSIKIRIRKGKSYAIYSIQSLKSLTNIIIPHFKKYPLITQKKADFELFCKIIHLMNNKEHLTEQGFFKLLSIKASLNKGLSNKIKELFPNIIPEKRLIINEKIINNN
jgi:LAGLIDADG endonuclease